MALLETITQNLRAIPDRRISRALFKLWESVADGVTAGVAVASKVAILGANKNIDTLAIADGGLKLGSGAGTAVLATADELNRATDVSTRIVSTTAATLAITLAAHDSKIVVLASTHTQTLTLPAATGTGARFRFVVSTTGTDGSKVIKVANTADVMTGVTASHSTATNEVSSFLTSATSDTITLNNTTTGGITGTAVEVIDIATGVFAVKVDAAASGTIATAFSAAV